MLKKIRNQRFAEKEAVDFFENREKKPPLPGEGKSFCLVACDAQGGATFWRGNGLKGFREIIGRMGWKRSEVNRRIPGYSATVRLRKTQLWSTP